MGDDRRYMMRALELARLGQGAVAPNPMVGCVIVKDGEVVGEGWHRAAGAPHAEAEALARAGEKARGAVCYVTLEPCAHFGRTPPCADALIAAGLSEVVYALPDPNPQAAGGASRLVSAGLKVRGEICAEEAADLNRHWIHAQKTGRPWVIAKFAASLDGRIATRAGESKWITGPEARARAHELRAEVDAIVVGAGTVIADDPSLTARPEGGPPLFPLRVVLDSEGRTPAGAAVYDRAGRGALIAATRAASPSRLTDYRAHGVDVAVLDTDEKGRPDARDLLPVLRERGVSSVLVEGGGRTLGAFFDAGLVDEVFAFIAPVVIGGGSPAVDGDGPDRLAGAWRLFDVATETLGRDLLMRGRVQKETA